MTKSKNTTITLSKTYSRAECCAMFGRTITNKRTFCYVRYRKKANFVLGPGLHRQPWHTKYFISGADLYKFIRSWRPDYILLMKITTN